MKILYPRRSAQVKTTLLPDGHVVVFNPKTDWAYTLNPAGAIVWEFCDGTHALSELSELVVKALPLPEAPFQAEDLEKLLGELAEAGLLEEGKQAA